MRTTFFGLEIARKALLTQQKALDVTGHNIANANTQGYTRQEAVLTTTNPWSYPAVNKPFPGQMGTGVQVDEIRRIRDGFLDLQTRKESTSLGYWEGKKDALSKIEVIINEPSSEGIRSVLDQFWFAMQELSKNPESLGVRAMVLERGVILAESFNHVARQLTELRMDTDTSIQIKTKEVNNIASQIATLNNQIVSIEASGDRANDLRDRRDLLIDQLSKLIDLQVSEEKDGSTTLIAAGRALVWGKNANCIELVPNPANGGYVDLRCAGDNEPVAVKGGTLKGLLETRDQIVVNYLNQMDTLAQTIATEVNKIHLTGYGLDNSTGLRLFANKNDLDPANLNDPLNITYDQSIKAGNIILNPALQAAPNRLAAANGPDKPGDGSNALKIAQLKNQNLMVMPGATSGTGTIDDFFRASVAQLGVDAQEANRMVDNQSFLVEQIENQKQAVSGVSLDEEMTNMIRFQHAYNAAARLVTAMDEMLDTIINGMGAGR